MAVRVSVIIVNWNGRHYLSECLDSLARQTFIDFETILVDNGSHDDSLAWLQACYPAVKVLALAENTGFAHANNRGFTAASGEYLVTLNNDTRTEPGWLAALVAAADSDPRIGMVGSRICTYADPERLDSLGVAICGDGMSRGAYRHRRFGTLGIGGVIDILLPSACAALYRRAMIDEIGGFDDTFFAYCEDTDLGLRGRRAGWRAVAASDAVVLHKYSATGGVFSPFKLYLVERNHYWAAVKTFPLTWLGLLPLTTAWRYLLQAWLVVRGQGSGREFRSGTGHGALLGALLRGQRDALRGLPRLWVARQRSRSQARLSDREFSRLLRRHRLTFRELLDAGSEPSI